MFLAYDPTKLIEVIKQMKDNCDYIFVYLHWGIEKNTEPESYQVELAHKLIDAGADAVIGSHPHVLQKIDFYNGIPIAYSLGNFMFNANISSTELLCIDIEESGTISVSIIPAAASSGKTYATSDMIIIKDE